MTRRIGVLAGALIILGAMVAPATAGPEQRAVDRFEEHWFDAFPDEEQGLVVLINVTREVVCTAEQVAFEMAFIAWLEAGEVGPPPAPPAEPLEGIEPATVQVVETGQGALVYSLQVRDVPMELWVLDEDAQLVGPCTDTDQSEEPVAAGTASFRINDNDLDSSGTRGNAFGDRLHATLTTADGSTLRIHARFHLNDRCYALADQPQACLVEFVQIR